MGHAELERGGLQLGPVLAAELVELERTRDQRRVGVLIVELRAGMRIGQNAAVVDTAEQDADVLLAADRK